MVAVFQAFHTADLKQKVVITGPGLNEPLIGISNPSTPKGTTFLSKEIVLGINWQPFDTAIYTVELSFIDGTQEKAPAQVVTVQSTPVGATCVTAWAFANDSGADQDINDTVVSISLFPYSVDNPK
jgi:hypothetical protein